MISCDSLYNRQMMFHCQVAHMRQKCDRYFWFSVQENNETEGRSGLIEVVQLRFVNIICQQRRKYYILVSCLEPSYARTPFSLKVSVLAMFSESTCVFLFAV